MFQPPVQIGRPLPDQYKLPPNASQANRQGRNAAICRPGAGPQTKKKPGDGARRGVFREADGRSGSRSSGHDGQMEKAPPSAPCRQHRTIGAEQHAVVFAGTAHSDAAAHARFPAKLSRHAGGEGDPLQGFQHGMWATRRKVRRPPIPEHGAGDVGRAWPVRPQLPSSVARNRSRPRRSNRCTRIRSAALRAPSTAVTAVPAASKLSAR